MAPDTPIRIDFPDSALYRALAPFDSTLVLLTFAGGILSFAAIFLHPLASRLFTAVTHKPAPKALWRVMCWVPATIAALALCTHLVIEKKKPHPKDVAVVHAIESHYDVQFRGKLRSSANPYVPHRAGSRGSPGHAERWDVSWPYPLETKDHRMLPECRTVNHSPTHDHLEITVTCGGTTLPRVR